MEILEWDSQHWGVRVGQARLEGTEPPYTRILDIDGWASRNTELVYLEVPADARDLICAAEKEGFRLVDVRVNLARDPSVRRVELYPPRLEDVEGLVAIARAAHTASRFYADPRLDDVRCADLYEAWIRNSCDGWADRVLVTRSAEGIPTGYITVHADPVGARIGLCAVAAGHQGRGYGTILVDNAVRAAGALAADRITVATQARNVAGLRLYIGMGFNVRSTALWFHKWYR